MAPVPIALFILGVAAVVLSWMYGLWSYGAPGPGLMPATAGVLVVCASVADIRGTAARSWTFSRRLLAHAAALTALPFASLVLGMLLALAIYLFVILHVVERRRLPNAVLIAILVTAGCYLLFERLLSVPLPKPPLL